jgi:hypothetical protein
MGQIASRNHGSNSWIKFAGQICRSNAANPRAAAGKPMRMHGHAYGQPENSLEQTAKRQRKTPRGEAWGLLDWRYAIMLFPRLSISS